VPAALAALGFVLGIVAKSTGAYVSELFYVFGIGAAVAALAAGGSSGGARLDAVIDGLRAVARGKRVRAPEGVSGDLAEVFDELGKLAKQRGELEEEVERLEKDTGGVDALELVQVVRQVARGERVRAPAGVSAELAGLYEAFVPLAERIAAMEAEQRRSVEAREALSLLEPVGPRLAAGLAQLIGGTEQAMTHIKTNTAALTELSSTT
jgi:hypothetical protein